MAETMKNLKDAQRRYNERRAIVEMKINNPKEYLRSKGEDPSQYTAEQLDKIRQDGTDELKGANEIGEKFRRIREAGKAAKAARKKALDDARNSGLLNAKEWGEQFDIEKWVINRD